MYTSPRLATPKRRHIVCYLGEPFTTSRRNYECSYLQQLAEIPGTGSILHSSTGRCICYSKLGYREVSSCLLNTVRYSGVDGLARNEYYNSKAGRLHDAEAADAATQGGTVRG